MKQLTILFLLSFYFSQLTYGQFLVPTLDKKTNKYGYKEKGQIEWSLMPTYMEASFFGDDNLAVVKDGNLRFAIDLNGKKVSPCFKIIFPTANYNFVPYICQDIDGNYNIYNSQFKPICETSFNEMSYMGDCVISFKSDNLYGLIDLGGNVLIPPIYRELSFEDYYYACGWKRCKKDGIDHKMFSEAFVKAQNKEGKWGIVTLNNEIMVPFKYNNSYKMYKGTKGAYNKVIKPYLLSTKKKELDQRIEEAKMRMSTKNKELATIYPKDLPAVEKTIVKKTNRGYAFFKENKQIGEIYHNIDAYDRCCIVSKNGKYGVTDPLGTEIVKCEYDNISIWNIGNGNDVLLAEADGKYGLLDADGTELSAKDCEMIFLPSNNNTGVAIKNGLYWLIDSKGNIVSRHGYDNINNYSYDNKIYAELLGYKTELSADGKETLPIAKQIFNKAYDMSLSDNAQEKFNTYMLCISLDSDNKEGYRALSLNNIGAMLEDLGDTDKAMEYYEQSRNLGNDTARKNIKRIKLDRTLNTISQVGNALSQMAQTLDTSGSYNLLQQSSGNYGTYFSDNYDVSIGGNSNKRSYEFWKQQYDRWERNAKSCYDALTNTGYKTKKNGKDAGGSAAGSWGASSFSGMKSNLRNAQREMRDIRARARKDGHNIPQSNYETINVSY